MLRRPARTTRSEHAEWRSSAGWPPACLGARRYRWFVQSGVTVGAGRGPWTCVWPRQSPCRRRKAHPGCILDERGPSRMAPPARRPDAAAGESVLGWPDGHPRWPRRAHAPLAARQARSNAAEQRLNTGVCSPGRGRRVPRREGSKSGAARLRALPADVWATVRAHLRARLRAAGCLSPGRGRPPTRCSSRTVRGAPSSCGRWRCSREAGRAAARGRVVHGRAQRAVLRRGRGGRARRRRRRRQAARLHAGDRLLLLVGALRPAELEAPRLPKHRRLDGKVPPPLIAGTAAAASQQQQQQQ